MAGNNAHLGSAKGSGDIQRKRRSVPGQRRKYGTPEGKKDLLARLAAERAERSKERELLARVAARRPDEFHFGYYSMNSKMQRRVEMTGDEMKKMLRYIDGEVSKCERRRMGGISGGRNNKHIKYDEDGRAVAGSACIEQGRGEGAGPVASSEDDGTACAQDSSEKEEADSMNTSYGGSPLDGRGIQSTEDEEGSDGGPKDGSNGYDSYIEQLLEKRKEVVAKLQALGAKKRKDIRWRTSHPT